MKMAILTGIIFSIFISCASTKKDSNVNVVTPIQQNTTQSNVNTTNTQVGNQETSTIIQKLKSDLGKSSTTLINENPGAVSLRSQGYPDTIVLGRGGVFGSGQFYGYSWSLKNGIVSGVSYLQQFTEKDYQDAIKNYTAILGEGLDINGNGFGWLIPERGGLTIILINGANNLIVHNSEMGYNSLLGGLRNK